MKISYASKILYSLSSLIMKVYILEFQWLKHRWLVCHGRFELVLEFLGKIHSCRFRINQADFLFFFFKVKMVYCV